MKYYDVDGGCMGYMPDDGKYHLFSFWSDYKDAYMALFGDSDD